MATKRQGKTGGRGRSSRRTGRAFSRRTVPRGAPGGCPVSSHESLFKAPG
ncbi:hypothetical protein Esi_0139_0030 [Ectocarpus siliculosus]|uniref:Uncharacterized protein n=1 Tax=Ectocarpus siliculosus TaxID=2880 RepID=D7FK03_ECTSI|nr:hypothetical protein Esi_0139_0030 [Ectocarpus siliculosus]|eukprot:CBJ49092.1 hypothetical protein Esi_0139_0030 [Ectocarpus siliculosus]